MPPEGQIYFELLQIEINAAHIKHVLKSQLKKGISPSQIIPAIEKDSLQKIRNSVSALLLTIQPSKVLKKDLNELEAEYIKVRSAINETLKWLEYLIAVYRQVLSTDTLPEGESNVIHNLEAELFELQKKLDPALKAVLKKRAEENRDIGGILQRAINHMEKETFVRTKKIVLKYEKSGKEKYDLIQSTFTRFFNNLRAHSDKILSFIQPKLPEWNEMVLSSTKGFFIEAVPDLPCSILFTVQGKCYLIFENVGHFLGVGVYKVVLRSICLPQGAIRALIKPIKAIASSDDKDSPEVQRAKKEKQFDDMWLEANMLMKLKNTKGIIEMDERMVFEIDGEKNLFLTEEYYWDGTLWDYLKYPIYNKIESAKLSKKKQRKILFDLLTGLAAINKNQIVHRDIKPDNILMDLKKSGGRAVIADFHLSAYLHDKDRILNPGFLPEWAAPECAKIHLHPDRPKDELSNDYLSITSDKLDIWSMGLVFYALIAYELPFWVQRGAEQNITIEAEELFPILAHLKKGWLPEHLKSSPYFPLLEKMLEPDPQDRCTAIEALQILNKCGP